MQQLRYYIYVRKSSESEERQQMSIPAQEKALLDLAKKQELSVVGPPIRESKSAKLPGRPLFNEMIENIKAGKAEGIICWHLDRLSRNPLDEAVIKCGLIDGTITEVVTPGQTYKNTPEDGLTSAIQFALATKYSQDLSRSVKRGNRALLEQGKWPTLPKLGYLRDPKSKLLIKDPERFQVLQEAWRMRLSGTSVSDILAVLRDEYMLTTQKRGRAGGRLISRSTLWRIFNDPFYAGLMVYGGETYPGTHPTMVSMSEFEEVQALIDPATPAPRPKQLFFAYRGLIQCGSCDALVTAEKTTNRHGKTYIYWHCCRKHRKYRYCPEPSVEQNALDEQIAEALDSLAVPDPVLQFALDELAGLAAHHRQMKAKAQARLAKQRQALQRRLERLNEMRLDGEYSTDEYASMKHKLLMEVAVLDQKLESDGSPPELLEPFEASISTLKQATSQFRHADEQQKRQIVKSVFSNPILQGKKLLISAKKPFSLFADLTCSPFGRSGRDHVRTLMRRYVEDLAKETTGLGELLSK